MNAKSLIKQGGNKSLRLSKAKADVARFIAEGNYHEAISHLREVMQKFPGEIDFLCDFGVCLIKTGMHESGLEQLRKAALRNITDVSVRLNLASAYLLTNNFISAIEQFQLALQLAPDRAEIHQRLAQTLSRVDRTDEAIPHFAFYLSKCPRDPEALLDLGWALKKKWQLPEALVLISDAVELFDRDHPRYPAALGMVSMLQGLLCDWSDGPARSFRIKEYFSTGNKGVIPTFTLIALPGISAEDQFNVAKVSGSQYVKEWLAQPQFEHTRPIKTDQRIRVAYFSNDFWEHATSILLAGVIEDHSREQFEIFAYSYGPDDQSELHQRMKCAFDVFHDVSGKSDIEIARLIYLEQIDILVDLKGWTTGTRSHLLAVRPAPIIVNWLGYPGTMGVSRMADYIISDSIVTPVELAHCFTETLALMPDCYQANDSKRQLADPDKYTRADWGLPDDAFVFCSFNQAYKYNEAVFDAWCKLLKAVPDSVLWLLALHDVAMENLLAYVEQQGISRDRIIFARVVKNVDHLNRITLADLALDPFPCNSHTTGADVLWAGVPMLTLIGDTFAGRVGASLLHNVGLDCLIANSIDEYVEIGVECALNPVFLNSCKAVLKNRLELPLFDTKSFVRNLEMLYVRMLNDYDNGIRSHILLESDLAG